jgi:hypothetical protein
VWGGGVSQGGSDGRGRAEIVQAVCASVCMSSQRVLDMESRRRQAQLQALEFFLRRLRADMWAVNLKKLRGPEQCFVWVLRGPAVVVGG